MRKEKIKQLESTILNFDTITLSSQNKNEK